MIHSCQPARPTMTMRVSPNKLIFSDYDVDFSYTIFVCNGSIITASQRKTLILSMMKVFRDDFPKLDDEYRDYTCKLSRNISTLKKPIGEIFMLLFKVRG